MIPFVILILIIAITWNLFKFDVEYIKSDIDDNLYIIRNGANKPLSVLTKTADTLAHINIRVEKLIEHLLLNFNNDTDKQMFITKLRENYHKDMISESANNPKYTTFLIDKSDMHICLRTRDLKEKLYDINLLMYVVLHELAHLCNYDQDGNPVIGHGREFKQIFRFLVQEAIKINLYTFKDYSKYPVSYCGMIISSTIIN